MDKEELLQIARLSEEEREFIKKLREMADEKRQTVFEKIDNEREN